MPKKILAPADAPKAIGPYSQGVDLGDFVFFAGQIPIDPATGDLVSPGDARGQTERILKNVDALLRAAGLGPDHVVKSTVFLVDLADFAAMNEVYGKYFTKEHPARSTVQVAALPKGARVEIEVLARRM